MSAATNTTTLVLDIPKFHLCENRQIAEKSLIIAFVQVQADEKEQFPVIRIDAGRVEGYSLRGVVEKIRKGWFDPKIREGVANPLLIAIPACPGMTAIPALQGF